MDTELWQQIDQLFAEALGLSEAERPAFLDAACGDDRELFSRADEQFHLMLAECTRNPLMVWLYRQINDVRSHALWDGMKDKILTKARIAEYNRQHRELYESLYSRDADAATQMIAAHLEKARRDLLGVDSQ